MPLFRRTVLAAAAAAIMATPALAASTAKVNPDLAQAARTSGQVEALIVLADQDTPAIAPLSPDADYKQRRRALVQALRTRAESQQLSLRIWLESRGIAYRPFWIANMVQATLSADDIDALAAAMEDCLSRSADELRVMGEAAYARVRERHSVDIQAAKLAGLFRESSR